MRMRVRTRLTTRGNGSGEPGGPGAFPTVPAGRPGPAAVVLGAAGRGAVAA